MSQSRWPGGKGLQAPQETAVCVFSFSAVDKPERLNLLWQQREYKRSRSRLPGVIYCLH